MVPVPVGVPPVTIGRRFDSSTGVNWPLIGPATRRLPWRTAPMCRERVPRRPLVSTKSS
jgi:hypothetical protein